MFRVLCLMIVVVTSIVQVSATSDIEGLIDSIDNTSDFVLAQSIMARIEQKYPLIWETAEYHKYRTLKAGLDHYFGQDRVKCIPFFKNYISILDMNGEIMGMRDILGLIRIAYDSGNLQEEKLQYYEEKLIQYRKKGPSENIATCYHGIAGYYYAKGLYNTAISYYSKAAEIYESFSNVDYGIELAVIGDTYSKWGNQVYALHYFELAEPILRESKIEYMLFFTVLSKAINYRKQERYDEAIHELGNLLTSAKDFRSHELNAIAFMEMGLNKILSQDYEEGLKDLLNAQAIGDSVKLKINNFLHDFEIDYCFYTYYALTMKFDKAERALFRAVMAANKAKSDVLLKKYHRALSQFYYRRGLFDLSAKHAQLFVGLLDNLDRQDNSDVVSVFEIEKKEREAQKEIIAIDKRRKNMIRNLKYLGIISFIILAGLYSRMQYIRRSKALLQAEKGKSEQLLLNILPAEVAEELKSYGRTKPRRYDNITVLFSDFSGFTAMSEQLEAEELVSEVDTCFSAFDEIMEKYGIEKIKTIGDAYMAAAGLYEEDEKRTSANAVLAAIEIQSFIRKRESELEKRGAKSFKMRVGLHTGSVIAGVVGTKKFQYDIWGDTVNLASRMESNGSIYNVNVSESIYRQLESDPKFVFYDRGEILVKGKGSMRMYFVEKSELFSAVTTLNS